MRIMVDLEDFHEIQRMLKFVEHYIKSLADGHYEYLFEYKLQYRQKTCDYGGGPPNIKWSEWKDIE